MTAQGRELLRLRFDTPRHDDHGCISTVFLTPILRNHHGDASGVRGATWLWK